MTHRIGHRAVCFGFEYCFRWHAGVVKWNDEREPQKERSNQKQQQTAHKLRRLCACICVPLRANQRVCMSASGVRSSQRLEIGIGISVAISVAITPHYRVPQVLITNAHTHTRRREKLCVCGLFFFRGLNYENEKIFSLRFRDLRSQCKSFIFRTLNKMRDFFRSFVVLPF